MVGAILGTQAIPPPTLALAAAPDRESIEFFEKKIRPVLVENCYKCHSVESKKKKGELWLDSRAAMLEGGKSGPVTRAGRPREESSHRSPSLQESGPADAPRTVRCRRRSSRISKRG